MAYNTNVGGNPNRTSYLYTAGAVAFTDGNLMPTGNLDHLSHRPIAIYEIDIRGRSANGAPQMVYYGATIGSNSGGSFFGDSGASARSQLYNTGGTMSFGRNTANGLNTWDSSDMSSPYSPAGGLCMDFNYGFAPAPPVWITATPLNAGQIQVQFSGSGDTGGLAITGWVYAWRVAGSGTAFNYVGSTGTSIFTGTPGVTYEFAAAGRNQLTDALGRWGGFTGTVFATAKAGGQVWDGSGWAAATGFVWDGSGWAAANGFVWDGSTWAPIS